jgi:uracil-DNA glycosylase
MLIRPEECRGCPLNDISTGFMAPSLGGINSPQLGVTLLGEALGEDEAEEGSPFVGRAGFRLTRLLEWAGYDRSGFDILNAVWCRPPDNVLEGAPYEIPSIRHCQDAHWGRLLRRTRVIVPLGNVPTNALLGRKGITTLRGYVYTTSDGHFVIPTVHPSFIQRGQSKYSAAFINDIQKAVELAALGTVPIQVYNYTLDPRPEEAYAWAKSYRRALERDSSIKLAYDIETPGKGEDEGEVDEDDPTYFIYRIGFSFRGHSGLSIPWEPPYLAAIRLLLESEGEKVVWNEGYDNPRILHNGVTIRGLIHDGMVAWHILHSDLPKGLGFVATFTCPWQEAWKHLSAARPAFYNCTDADVELRSMQVIEAELKANDLWDVYQRDVLDLAPILHHMHKEGMPIDATVRLDRAKKLDEKRRGVLQLLEASTPLEARKIDHVFAKTPKVTDGLLSRPTRRRVKACPRCGCIDPKKDHFRTFKKPTVKKPQNPCAGLVAIEQEIDATEWYRLHDFTPSRDQILRYQKVHNRFVPTKWDKKSKSRKISLDEKAMKTLIGKYGQEDPFYARILEYRELDKLAGTYIGRPSGQ